jgi:predicted RNase H-like HicB family nuclease
MADRYVAVIHPPVGNSAYGVTFPDLPGCVSSGTNVVDAIGRAVEALAGHVAALRADGEPLPSARPLHELLNDEEFLADIRTGAEATAVPVMDVPAPKERVNIMISRDVLRKVDQAAAGRGISRSAFIEAAASRAAGRS